MNKTIYNFDRSNKYLICCDLDGTLLNSKGELTKYTIDAVKRISDEGHAFCLLTGRPYNGSIALYNELQLKTIMANQNGAFITNPSNPTFIPIAIGFSCRIATEIFSNERLKKYMNNAIIEGLNKSWMWYEPDDRLPFDQMKDIFHLQNRDIEIINQDASKFTTDISSILIHIDDLTHLNTFIYEVKNIAPTLIVRTFPLYDNFASGTIVEINTKFVSKGMAMKLISAHYGIPLEQCICIGDGDNDVEMIGKAGWGFAMKNGSSAAVLAARYMTKDTNNDDGVVKELLRFLDIN